MPLLIASPLVAQDAAAPPSQFGERVEVQLVNVEAWVTDADGNPVLGLGAEDFEVLEDGRPVEITHFAEVRRERPAVARSRREARREEPPASVTASPALVLSDGSVAADPVAAEPPRLVIYFDFLRLGAVNRKRLTRDLRDFLAEGGVASENVLLLRQDEDLEILAAFGSSDEQVAAALTQLEREATLSASQQTRFAVERLQQLWQESQINSLGDPCTLFTRRAAPLVDQLARELRAQNEETLGHLAETASFLAGLPGLKTLLYVGDALATTPGNELITFVEAVCPASQQDGQVFRVPEAMGEAFHALTRHANANRVTIYTVQPSGLQPSFLGSASEGAVDFRGTADITAFDSALRGVQRAGLQVLAEETGGRAIFNTNRFDEPLERLGEEMHQHYSLAYAPPHGGDGQSHRVEVKVRDPKLRVRHRQGYRDKSPSERLAERVEAAAYLGITDNPLDARLGAGVVELAGRKTFRLPLHVMVPAENVVFLPGEGGETARLAVQVSVRDQNNRRVAWVQKLFGVDRPESGEAEIIDLALDLELEAGEYVVAVGLGDDASGESSFLATTLALQPPPAGGG